MYDEYYILKINAMKKNTLLLSALLMISFSSFSQRKLVVHKINGEIVEFVASEVSYIDFNDAIEESYIPDANGYEYVDLGLPSGTKWATMNVGADCPEDYGDYFAWAETEPKSTYNWETYKWMTSGMSISYGINKYTVADDHTHAVWYDSNGDFIGDNKNVLELSDDAANVNWGGDWRIPTIEEQDELRTECDWTWNTKKAVNGYTVTGPNGNSIFLPAAGDIEDCVVKGAGSIGEYWSNAIRKGGSFDACYLSFNSYYVVKSGTYRYYGCTIRPVLP